MNVVIFVLALALFTFAPIHGIKKCTKIDACRCSTDEGEINLWSLAGQTPNQPRFSFAEALVANISDQTKESYQWNPCDSWTAQTLPDESGENGCKDVAVCFIKQIDGFGTIRTNIGEQKLSDCVLNSGRCLLTYGVSNNKQIETSIALVCNETEEGKMFPMHRFAALSVYHTSLYSKCACPGKCSGLSAGAIVGIVVGSIAAFLLLAFAVFICCLRRRLPSGLPKPSMCTTIKVGFGLITAQFCPCCKRCHYRAVPGK